MIPSVAKWIVLTDVEILSDCGLVVIHLFHTYTRTTICTKKVLSVVDWHEFNKHILLFLDCCLSEDVLLELGDPYHIVVSISRFTQQVIAYVFLSKST